GSLFLMVSSVLVTGIAGDVVIAHGALVPILAAAAVPIAALVAHAATRRTVDKGTGLNEAARGMAGGDLAPRPDSPARDELGELGKTLDLLAGSLARTLDELRSERDLLQGILNAMQEGVLVLDAGGRFALVNPALRGMFLFGNEVIGKKPLEVIRHAELVALIARAERADGPVGGEIELGGMKPRRLMAQAARLKEPGGLLLVFFDVTDVRRLESLRRDFVANVSHELRTPVT